MKIGILGCFYDCYKNLDKVIQPWIEVKQVMQQVSFEIAAVNAQFKEYADIQFQNDNERTILGLEKIQFDFLHIQNEKEALLNEAEARNIPLKYLLSKDVDFVWLLDGDEIYTVEQIIRIVEFIRFNRNTAWFSLNFKNYVFDGKSWLDGFCPPRIFRTRYRELKLQEFYWDNDLSYSNGAGEKINYKSLNTLDIPRGTAHIQHLSWLNEDGKKKVEYQLKHFGLCSYLWNSTNNSLEFDYNYFTKYNQPIPVLNKD